MILWWVHPGQQPNIQPASHSLPSPMAWEGNRRKARILIYQDNGSLTGKAKAAWTSKAKSGLHSLFFIVRQMFSFFLQGRASFSTCGGCLGRQMPSPQTSHPLPFPKLLLLSMASYDMEYPSGQFGPTVLSTSAPNFLPAPSILAAGQKPGYCASFAQQ